MDRWDEIAIITFITCDTILENIYEINNFYKYYYGNIKKETKDIIMRLFRWKNRDEKVLHLLHKMINIKFLYLGKHK